MYDLHQMTLRDMSECGLALRHLGDGASSIEEVSNNIIQYLYENFVDKQSGEKACALVRLFKTHPYRDLTPELQEDVGNFLGDNEIDINLKCLTLLATAGELPEWNSRHTSEGHKAIPLVSEEAIARIPMIFQLINQLGLNPEILLQPDADLLIDLEQKMYNIFYVADALDSPYIPAQKSFVIPYNIKSVIGFGGLLPSGNMFTILIFSKVAISRTTVDLFRPLALNVKMALLPFEGGKIFQLQNPVIQDSVVNSINNQIYIHQNFTSKIATLSQLLDVSEQSTILQSDRLEEAISQLQNTLNKLQSTQSQLVHTEKMSSLGQMIAGIAHEINNPANFIYGNLTHTQQYTQHLLELVQIYQKFYPHPSPDIQSFIDTIELDFVSKDLNKIIESMKNGTERIMNIVNSLRNFSRLDEAELKKVDIHQGIESTLMILEHRLRGHGKNKKIDVVKKYGNLPKVECCPGQINQVFMNILTNAIDALQQNEGYNHKICIQTKIISNGWIAVSINDNGAGIAPDNLTKVFDPFFTTKAVGKGTGLGLSICYQIIVDKHRGYLDCNSKLGEGSEFIIKLPVNFSTSLTQSMPKI
ncbi:MAG: sensor histidine kinase [Scytonematopsis contorta HA4267-MV1]|jgi:signal transduction histidine kinase|nr:sensor histidine kinase [Scytonematopsis contorta HA4267-MV1]